MINAQNRFSGTVLGVDSGDTIRVQLTTLVMTVRLHGVESPTSPVGLAEKARLYTERRIGKTAVTVEVRGTGARQTVYGEVYISGGESLNQELIRLGIASWAKQYAPARDDLALLEEEARNRKRGIWGDFTGANILLPPVPTPPPTPRPTPKATAAPTPVPSPTVKPTTAPTATPRPAPAPVSRNRTLPESAPPSARPASLPTEPSPFLLPILGVVGWMLLSVAGVLLQRMRPGGASGTLVAQAALSIAATTGMALLLPVLFLLVKQRFFIDASVLCLLILSPLIAVCLFFALRLFRGEQQLRGIPVMEIAHLPEGGMVRISGRTSAPQGVVYSDVGRIPGIFVEEQSYRFQADTQGAVRALRWHPRHHRTRTADFLLTDETGSILVEASKASFHPLRVARFYNDIPVEQFFDQSYSGDVRSEVFFIPEEATVTVWGRCITTASPFPGSAERHIAMEGLTETLIVVEGNANRLFTRRPLFGLLLTLLAALLSVGVSLSLALPGLVNRLLPFAGGQ